MPKQVHFRLPMANHQLPGSSGPSGTEGFSMKSACTSAWPRGGVLSNLLRSSCCLAALVAWSSYPSKTRTYRFSSFSTPARLSCNTNRTPYNTHFVKTLGGHQCDSLRNATNPAKPSQNHKAHHFSVQRNTLDSRPMLQCCPARPGACAYFSNGGLPLIPQLGWQYVYVLWHCQNC